MHKLQLFEVRKLLYIKNTQTYSKNENVAFRDIDNEIKIGNILLYNKSTLNYKINCEGKIKNVKYNMILTSPKQTIPDEQLMEMIGIDDYKYVLYNINNDNMVEIISPYKKLKILVDEIIKMKYDHTKIPDTLFLENLKNIDPIKKL